MGAELIERVTSDAVLHARIAQRYEDAAVRVEQDDAEREHAQRAGVAA